MRVHTTHRTRRARRGEATTEDQQDCMSADSRRSSAEFFGPAPDLPPHTLRRPLLEGICLDQRSTASVRNPRPRMSCWPSEQLRTATCGGRAPGARGAQGGLGKRQARRCGLGWLPLAAVRDPRHRSDVHSPC
ncbi:unnamed protein product, partial [Prorocentrum cordatum]